MVAAPVAATTSRGEFPAVPVTSCQTTFGGDQASAPRIADQLPLAATTKTAARVAFYSDGFVTLLGPRGWSCHGVEAADGGRSLSVFPPGQTDPLLGDHLGAGASGVTAIVEYTGHGPGAQLVCGLFPHTAAADLARGIASCPAPPSREQLERPTPDVVVFRDPPGVTGSGAPSGGHNPATGLVNFPQLRPEPSSVPVAKETCTLPSSTGGLCGPIVADFLTRSLPAVPSSTGG
ncbi:MAG TPA: hypothetical protein VLV81_14045 [Acidimicrobiia bacterium]|nr:hypothetical protein [Acidimicrobiia bacterium]